jgi:hypothetical protein
MSKNEELLETDEGKQLYAKLNKAFANARKCAYKVDVDCAKKALSEFMNISAVYEAIAVVFASLYINELEKSLINKEDVHKISHGIKNYIEFFSKDEQIENIFKIFKKYYPESKLDIDKIKEGSKSSWKPGMIINSIFEQN